MNECSIGFIGSGPITRIILGGWHHAQLLPSRIIVSDHDEVALNGLKLLFPSIETTSDCSRAAAQDLVFLATPLDMVIPATQRIAAHLHPDAVLVSLVPQFTIEKLSALLGTFSRIVRLALNAPSVIGAGYNPIVFARALNAWDKAQIVSTLSPLGKLPEIEERKLEIYSVLTAMGPTYFMFQLQTLREVAVQLGLNDEEVKIAISHMVDGSLLTLLKSELPTSEVLDLIPDKPLSEMEDHVRELYRTRIPAMYQKIKPVALILLSCLCADSDFLQSVIS